jgi:chromosome segregation protein
MVGFKSFSGKTKLEFEPGMTSVVGPNGCGKSNIADAIRWVLGEQSAKALRGSKMEDIIFNGTDTAKPMGMAEVSLTLTDCEASLGTDYHEVTVTRRVLRSGEGQYFINKAPCRLKDIQRLFMDTGIGTSSYSLMAQGRIDRILSSRPEDRRSVFEEASGITKYKADKKEALRKLDHTEANLLRLDDIIREVRRQIISLQRQAGKARRFQEMQEKLRAFDIFHTKNRLKEFEQEIQDLENKLSSLREREEAARDEVRTLDEQATSVRETVARQEQEIGEYMEAVSEARSQLERCRELIRVNEDRILELKALAERDSRDAEEATSRLDQHKAGLDSLLRQLETATAERDQAKAELSTHNEGLLDLEQRTTAAGDSLHQLRTELVDLESRAAKTQNELADIEAQERTTVVRRERLAAEQGELKRSADLFAERKEAMTSRLTALAETKAASLQALEQAKQERAAQDERIRALRQELGDLRSRSAAKEAQIEMLQQSAAQAEGFPGGARMLLDDGEDVGGDREAILGSLAEHIQTTETYRVPLEAVLRVWLDAVIVRDEAAATRLMRRIGDRSAGSVRMLSTTTSAAPPHRSEGNGATRLLDQVTFSDAVRPVMERLLWNVFVVDSVDAIPEHMAWDCSYVSHTGAIRRGDGTGEVWMPDEQESNPLARRQQLARWEDDLQGLVRTLEEKQAQHDALQARATELDAQLEASRETLQEAARQLASCQGENQVVAEEARQAGERLDTVSFELNALNDQENSGENRRSELLATLDRIRRRQEEARTTIATNTDILRRLEQERSAVSASVTEHRVKFAESRQRVEHLESQRSSLASRVSELETLIRERNEGLSTYTNRVADLTTAREEAQARIEPLEADCSARTQNLEYARRDRGAHMTRIAELDTILREKRSFLEQVMNQRSELDVELAQERLRHQTAIERVATDYHITLEEVLEHPEPEWENGDVLDGETLETTVGELRTKLDAMGPVNLVAIDEHRELEERYAFLTQQQDDLVKAKQQLMDMIREINKTTTEMFSKTFNQVNENFQEMFKKLFGGGTAKLVLIDEEDVLDSGIEIIARPPGKKLQTVSLLSGGERTMTAVALLFSLYMVKPSAFCVLDELDAALDEANIGRFVETVKGFLEHSQFIVITHNRRTIGASDILYGVTMQERGVSKVVSVKFSDYERSGGKIPADAPVVPL